MQGVYQVLAEKIAVYETMSAELIAETLSRVFVDARECFSHLGPGLPESQLYSLQQDLRGCSLQVSIMSKIQRERRIGRKRVIIKNYMPTSETSTVPSY